MLREAKAALSSPADGPGGALSSGSLYAYEGGACFSVSVTIVGATFSCNFSDGWTSVLSPGIESFIIVDDV